MQVHGAGTDILLVHRRVELGREGINAGESLETRGHGISFGESLESLGCKQNTGNTVWYRSV